MNLPETFLRRMQKRLGERFPAFLHAMEDPPCKGVRANPLKLTAAQLSQILPVGDGVPWEENGFYCDLEKVGSLPAHHAGLFYSQEPSAMCAAPLLGAQAGERVLDLCAAPGGKTTQLAGAMGGEGVLVANEYVYDRARILSQNVERLGVANCAVISTDTASLAARLPAYFDKVLVDAPCSGEGMFRKDANAVAEWSEENVAHCIARQSAILDDAAALLAGGGTLVYSTCTFEYGENEGQIRAFLARHPEFTLVEEHLLLPHEVRGEGHYAAKLVKEEGARHDAPAFPQTRDRAAERAWQLFAADFFLAPPSSNVTTLSDGRMYLLPAGLPALSGRVLRAGIELGRFDGKRFTPAHALAMSARAENVRRTAPIDDEACAHWLRGETLASSMPEGWGVATWRGYPVGLAKSVGGTLKNHYPKGLREH